MKDIVIPDHKKGDTMEVVMEGKRYTCVIVDIQKVGPNITNYVMSTGRVVNDT